MKKIIISLILLGFVALYVTWHLGYRDQNINTNVVDNLKLKDKSKDNEEDKLPFEWLRQSYLSKNGAEKLVDKKEECFSLYELKTIYSSSKDTETLQQFCDSDVENTKNGYKISSSCQNQSARFYVEVEFIALNAKMYEWQQTILDINHKMVQQERITFQQQGTCNVTN